MAEVIVIGFFTLVTGHCNCCSGLLHCAGQLTAVNRRSQQICSVVRTSLNSAVQTIYFSANSPAG